MDIVIQNGGPLTTLQDTGRIGYQQYGVVVSGAMDSFSLRLANILVGNHPQEGALEMTMAGPSLKIPKGLVFALTGADMGARLNGIPVPRNRPVYARTDALLRFGFASRGARAYLAVAGGFDVPPVMNSKSTYLRAQMGGWKGRALKGGDQLPLGTPSKKQQAIITRLAGMPSRNGVFSTVPWGAKTDFIFEEAPIRVTSGLQYDWFTKGSLDGFFSTPFRITTNSDRMGYRLQGAPLAFREKRDLISEPINLGAIQVPPDGQPIILMADRQTTGGYPKIAQVILADLPRLAQMKPGQSLSFQLVTLNEAERSYEKAETFLEALQQEIEKRE